MAVAGTHRRSDQGRVVTHVERPSPVVIESFRDCYTAFALDFLGKLGAMSADLLPLSPGMRALGPAVTALGPDLTVRRMAIDLAQEGDVLVVATGGYRDTACFGDGTARRMRAKGMAGVVVDGLTRDAAGIRALGFPTFVRGVSPRNHHYPVTGDHGGVNVPVVCAGVLVHPGDLVLADDDGVVVVPREAAAELASRIPAALAEERRERNAMVTYRPFAVEDELRRRGYRFE